MKLKENVKFNLFLQEIRGVFQRAKSPAVRKLFYAIDNLLTRIGLSKVRRILIRMLLHRIVEEPVITLSSNRSLYTYYLQGVGIEIGALNGPLEILHNHARVKYVDYRSKDELKKLYPSLNNIINVDIISSAENLEGIEDDSLDFIVANHVIEHLVNPIMTLEKWHRKLKKRGILYLAFPDALRCPDKVRRITPLSHHLNDYSSNTKETSDEHLLGFTYAWNPNYFKDPDEIGRALRYMWERDLDYIDGKVKEILLNNQSCVEGLISNRNTEVHQHAFDYQSMKGLFLHVYNNYEFKYKLVDLSMTKHLLSEYIFILRKVAQCEGPFMDEFARCSEEKEKFLEAYIKENTSFIAEQRKILDQRYEIIQELTKAITERHPTS